MIVDDSIVARKNLHRMIERFGGRIASEATDGVTAIAEYHRTRPDIVLMDITMPNMDGIEATKEIVHLDPRARIVMVSAVGFRENVKAALESGARGFIQKPIRLEALYENIQHALGEDGALDEAVETSKSTPRSRKTA